MVTLVLDGDEVTLEPTHAAAFFQLLDHWRSQGSWPLSNDELRDVLALAKNMNTGKRRV